MKAYDIKYGTKVKIISKIVIIPIGALPVITNDIITIFQLDGMYCNGTNKNGD